MGSLEYVLRQLAAKLTGKNPAEMPRDMEGIIGYAADNYEAGQGGNAPGEPGAAVSALELVVDAEGKITGGSCTRTDGETFAITVTPAEEG